MAQTINWVEPDNTNVGSVLIYRADNNYLDSIGSRSIISTVGAKDVGGEWVTEYSDAGGNEDSVYRVQFFDGIGSSSLSDPISRFYSEQLATFKEVLHEARIGNNYDIGSYDVFQAIEDASDMIYAEYGDPARKTTFFVDSKLGIEGQVYDFTGNSQPVYQIKKMFVDSVNPVLVKNTDYEVNYNSGLVKFSDSFIHSYNGKNVYVEWVPQIVSNLVKYMAAKDLVEGELLFTGAGNIDNPKVTQLQNKINRAVEAYRPKRVFSAKLQRNFVGAYEIIPQSLERAHLYFNY